MNILTFLLVLWLLQTCHPSSSISSDTLLRGASLRVEKTNIDVLVSANGVFSAGFISVGVNAFCFAIWFTNLPNSTMVWMANRDQPVGARNSELSLLKIGNLILKDADGKILWTTNTVSHFSVKLRLLNTGNLVLRTVTEGVTLWESFGSPTDTLLPQQPLTKDTYLVSSRSHTNYSSGNYKLFFDNNNVLSLLFQIANLTSIYWPNPDYVAFGSKRTTYNSSRIALLDFSGHFLSSDALEFYSADYGRGPHRRLTLDIDGHLRLYSLEETNKSWVVSWQASGLGCKVHGLCGPNGVCSVDPRLGRRCSCLPGFRLKNSTNWSDGCEPEFTFSCNTSEVSFISFAHVDFYGYDIDYIPNATLKECKEKCSNLCNCKGFQHKFDKGSGSYYCYPKTPLLNGQLLPDYPGDFYIKVPKADPSFNVKIKGSGLNCPPEIRQPLNRMYQKSPGNGTWKVLLWFVSIIGVVEATCIYLVWFLLFSANRDPEAAKQGYLLAATGFKRFTYAELKKATNGFIEEIGRGGGGVVYKAWLPDERVAAIKRLNEAIQGEAEFLAELKTIGKLNHMNLIEMWGYCAEGKHRLLVYEYMEHGSLADNLSSDLLDWKKRFEIAIGTAKGLAYLHDECLQWVLQCDIKPQNILLDSSYQPKVSDFGLSKLLNRGGHNGSSFSRIRGTRGYMAPEWVYNLPITSKVDVYSYGVVLLEMVTGKSPISGFQTSGIEGVTDHRRLITWVREKINGAPTREAWIEEVIDPMIASNYDVNKVEVAVNVALQCVEEEMDARATMRQVVEMLLCNEDQRDKIF